MTSARLLLLFALSITALFANAETVIAIDHANPPFMYQEKGQAKGLYPLMLQAIFKRAGEKVEIQAMPWKRALMKGENAEVGIGGIYKNAERLKIYDYSEPIFEEKLIVYVPKDKAFEFRQVADLYGKKVGVIRGWSYTEELDQAIKAGHIDAHENSSDESNFKILASGRLDAIIAIEMAGEKLIQRLELDTITPLAPPLSVNPTYLVFAKKANRQALLERFNQTLLDMKNDGSLQELVQKATASE